MAAAEDRSLEVFAFTDLISFSVALNRLFRFGTSLLPLTNALPGS